MVTGTFTHFIGGVRVSDPKGWQEFTEEIERNYKLRIIASKYPSELTFHSDGYEALRQYYLEGYCASVTYEAYFKCEEGEYLAIQGEIIISDVEWNLNKCTAKASVADNGIGARILNNSKINIYPTAETTKNGEAITAVTPIGLDVFSSTGIYLGTTREAYDWYSCMEHLIGYITDNEVSVTSDWYAALPDEERYCVVYGYELRNADGSALAPSYSFAHLYDEIARKYNLMAGIQYDNDGSPILRIEEEDYWYGDRVALEFPNQDDLIQSVDNERLYATIKLGSSNYIKDQDVAHPMPFLPLIGFTEEQLNIEGTCNTDNELDTSSSWIIDTNVIDDSVINDNDDYDDDLFLIQYTASTEKATRGTYLVPSSNPYMYNEQLLNSNVAARQHFQLSGIQNYAPQDAQFRAELTTTTPHTGQVFTYTGMSNGSTVGTTSSFHERYDDDYTSPNEDPDNNYGNGTTQGNPVSQANSRYTSPAIGFFQFEESSNVRILRSFQSAGGVFNNYEEMHMIWKIRRYNSSNTLLSTEVIDSFTIINFPDSIPDVTYTNYPFDITFHAYWNASANSGDYFEVWKDYSYISYCDTNLLNNDVTIRTMPGTYWKTNFVATGGGQINADPDDYRVILYDFERSLPMSDWVSLRADPKNMIQVATDETESRYGHIKRVRRNIATGQVQWQLVANRDQDYK